MQNMNNTKWIHCAIFKLVERSRPPLSVFRAFKRGEFLSEDLKVYSLQIPGETSESLRKDIQACLKSDESVIVYRSSKALLALGSRGNFSWEASKTSLQHKRRLLRKKRVLAHALQLKQA
jgi:hypothetical protein